MASSPSVSAAGPGWRISGDLISTSLLLRTAGIASQPGRCLIFSAPPSSRTTRRGSIRVQPGSPLRARRCGPSPPSCCEDVEKHPCHRRSPPAPRPNKCRRSAGRPIPRRRSWPATPRVAAAISASRRSNVCASASAFSLAPISAPSVLIIAKMPAISRWLKACTATPSSISSAAICA